MSGFSSTKLFFPPPFHSALFKEATLFHPLPWVIFHFPKDITLLEFFSIRNVCFLSLIYIFNNLFIPVWTHLFISYFGFHSNTALLCGSDVPALGIGSCLRWPRVPLTHLLTALLLFQAPSYFLAHQLLHTHFHICYPSPRSSHLS